METIANEFRIPLFEELKNGLSISERAIGGQKRLHKIRVELARLLAHQLFDELDERGELELFDFNSRIDETIISRCGIVVVRDR